MANVKVSSKVDEEVWAGFQALARDSHQSISGLLTEALREYIHRRRVRPETLRHLDDSMDRNDELGQLLAK